MTITNNNESILKHFVLPLFGLKPLELQDVYVSSCLNKCGDILFVKVLRETDFNYLSNYQGTIDLDNTYHVFSVPDIYKDDMLKLIDGYYSQMSKSAKNVIRQDSGLKYMVRDIKNNTVTSSALLLGLEKHGEYKKKLERDLQVKFKEDDELISKLTNSAFVEFIMEGE